MKNTPNILFINPAPMNEYEQSDLLGEQKKKPDGLFLPRRPEIYIPTGIIEIAAYLRQEIENISIEVIDVSVLFLCLTKNGNLNQSVTVESFHRDIIDTCEYKPDIVGISMLLANSFKLSMLIADLVKRKWPNVTIVCGGNHATFDVKNVLNNSSVDYVIRGEAELSFTEFVKVRMTDENPDGITGVISRDKLQKNLYDETSPMLQDLNQLPLPAYDLLDMGVYRAENRTSVMLSRGCVFKCTFCNSHTIHGAQIRDKPTPKIHQELMHLVSQYKVDHISIMDDLPGTKKAKFIELLNFTQKLGIKVDFPNALSVAVMNEALIDALCLAKLDYFTLAIESGSEHVQKHVINKRVPLDKAKRLVEYIKGKQKKVITTLILGFPNETKDMREESIDYYRNLDIDWIYVLTALPLPGTVLMQQFESANYIDRSLFDWSNVRHMKRTFDTDEITADQLEMLVYDTNIDLNFFNNNNMRKGRYKDAIDMFDYIVLSKYPYHIVGRYCRGIAFLHLQKDIEAQDDFNSCVNWIKTNDESKRLYHRYKSKMPLLDPILT